MFRPLLRKKQEISNEECIEILTKQLRGVLSVNGDDGYPYGMPINHYYNPDDGYIYFHGGKMGHKIDAMKKDNKVSYCVLDDGHRNEGEWYLTFKSVIVYGKVEFVEEEDKVIDISRKLSKKFIEDDSYIDDEIKKSLKGTLMFVLKPEYITGKLVKEK